MKCQVFFSEKKKKKKKNEIKKIRMSSASLDWPLKVNKRNLKMLISMIKKEGKLCFLSYDTLLILLTSMLTQAEDR